MKKIYILLMHTNTKPSKFVKLMTKYEYSHVAISLEKECSKSQRVKVSNIKAFCKAMDERNIPYSILSDTQADIFGEISVTELVTALLAEDCTVFSVETRDESLENYYMNLVGGRHYE